MLYIRLGALYDITNHISVGASIAYRHTNSKSYVCDENSMFKSIQQGNLRAECSIRFAYNCNDNCAKNLRFGVCVNGGYDRRRITSDMLI